MDQYSATVQIWLELPTGEQMKLSHLAPNYCRLSEYQSVAPQRAILKKRIDDSEQCCPIEITKQQRNKLLFKRVEK